MTTDDTAAHRSGEDRPRHRLAERATWPWLPSQENGILKQHAWCADCGKVRVTGSDRALDLGGIVNLLARVEKHLSHHGHRVTEAQKRLVVKKIQSVEGDDSFALTRTRQISLISGALSEYLHVHADVMESYVRSC